MKKILLIIAALVVLFISYFYLSEYLAYKDVMNSRTPDSWGKYYAEFPDGRHLEDVRYVQTDVERNIEVVRNFLIDYPTGEYSNSVSALKNSLWDAEILKYKQKLSTEDWD